MALKIQNNSIYSLAFVCAAIACQFTLTAATFAATDTENVYTDSVYSWGIWELGLEPASGPQAPASKAMNDRSRQLLFRPNDNAAYITQSIPVPPISTITPQPILPPIPVGPPGFTSGVPTTADPRN